MSYCCGIPGDNCESETHAFDCSRDRLRSFIASPVKARSWKLEARRKGWKTLIPAGSRVKAGPVDGVDLVDKGTRSGPRGRERQRRGPAAIRADGPSASTSSTCQLGPLRPLGPLLQPFPQHSASPGLFFQLRGILPPHGRQRSAEAVGL